jgi:hypothetical protein
LGNSGVAAELVSSQEGLGSMKLCRFSWFSLVSPDRCWEKNLRFGYDHILANHYSPIILIFDTVWFELLTVLLNHEYMKVKHFGIIM